MRTKEEYEKELYRCFIKENYEEFATLLIEAYGKEILGFLTAILGSQSDSHEVFSIFCEDMWKGLTTFRYSCSSRAWAYTLARHAVSRYCRSAWNRNFSSLSKAPPLVYCLSSKSITPAYLETGRKNQLRDLRRNLSESDQWLLVLRVDRKMSYCEIAQILNEQDDSSEVALDQLATRLRQRFSRIKQKLQKMAQHRGLILTGC